MNESGNLHIMLIPYGTLYWQMTIHTQARWNRDRDEGEKVISENLGNAGTQVWMEVTPGDVPLYEIECKKFFVVYFI